MGRAVTPARRHARLETVAALSDNPLVASPRGGGAADPPLSEWDAIPVCADHCLVQGRKAMPAPALSGPCDPPPAVAYFQARASGYAAASRAGLWAWQRRREAAAVAALAGEVAGGAALDLGCGAGFYAVRLADAGARPVVALDASPAMIAAIADPRVTGLVGDAATAALDRRFRLVLLAGLLEFVADPGAVLANARRHLEPGGRIVALVPPDNFAGRLYRRFHRRHGFAIALFGRRRFAVLAERAGLAVLRSRAVFPYGDAHAMAAR
jgi:SAM-dependent methyltransferase